MLASVRARRRYPRRARKSALPHASLFFLASVAGLAAWFYAAPPAAPAHLRDVAAARVPARGDELLAAASVRTAAGYGDLCTREGNVFSSKASLAFLIPGVIFTFVGLAIVTDDYFVAALERICERLSLSEDVAGATFMAAGSSTPEFFASMLGVFVTKDEVGIGTIVGSAVFNILVIIGLSAALAGAVLKLDWRPLMRDSFFYIVSIVLLLLFVLGPSKGSIRWYEGLILVATYGVYVLFMAYGNKRYMKWAGGLSFKRNRDAHPDLEAAETPAVQEPDSPTTADTNTWTGSISPNVSQEKPKYSDLNPRTRFRALQYAVIAANRLASSSSSENSDASYDERPNRRPSNRPRSILGIDLPTSILGWIFFPMTFIWQVLFKFTIVDCSSEERAHLWWITFLTSIAWISGISYVMVEAARISGCLIGIPAPAMGLTVLAAGTSVPDALASISVARDGAGDMAVSNAIGSNVFDILLGLGFPWFLGDLILRGDKLENGGFAPAIVIPTSPIATVVVPILILFAIMIVFLILLIIMRWQLKPALGYSLFGVYGIFVVYTILDVYVFKFSITE